MRHSGRVRQPSTLRMVIWPEASRAQNNIAAVSAEGSTVCVLMRRLNSSWSRSTALVVRADFHWLSGNRVKVNSRSPASSKLSATARHFIPAGLFGDWFCPGARSERSDAFGCFHELVRSVLAGIENGFVGVPYAMAQPIAAQERPDIFHWI